MTDLTTPPNGTAVPAINGSTAWPTVEFELLITIGILLALLMGALDQFVALTALPNILTDFGQPGTSGVFVISAYVIASTTAIPLFAKLSDLWSRRNVFLGGLTVFIVGSVLSGLSQNLPELILFRAVQGFGSGGFFPVGIAIVAVVFPPETRARVIGGLSGVFGIAVVAGPLLGSAIVTYTTWRWVFYVNIPIGLAGFALIALTLGPLRPERVRKFDIIGAALLAGWVASVMYPLYQIADAGWTWTDSRVLILLGVGGFLIIVFVLWELRAENPLVPVRLFTHRVMAAGGGATFFIGMVFFPVGDVLGVRCGVRTRAGLIEHFGNGSGHPLFSDHSLSFRGRPRRPAPHPANIPRGRAGGPDHWDGGDGRPDPASALHPTLDVQVRDPPGRGRAFFLSSLWDSASGSRSRSSYSPPKTRWSRPTWAKPEV